MGQDRDEQTQGEKEEKAKQLLDQMVTGEVSGYGYVIVKILERGAPRRGMVLADSLEGAATAVENMASEWKSGIHRWFVYQPKDFSAQVISGGAVIKEDGDEKKIVITHGTYLSKPITEIVINLFVAEIASQLQEDQQVKLLDAIDKSLLELGEDDSLLDDAQKAVIKPLREMLREARYNARVRFRHPSLERTQ